jgi:alginate O-acetyltransferase complex protein AlgI
VAGLVLSRLPRGERLERVVFVSALLVPVAGLVTYKYRGLLLSSLASLGLPVATAPEVSPALPLAISFFTFEFVHYLTDVHHGSEPIESPLRFLFFAIFFPSIVSGPIKRYQPFLAQVEEGIPRPPLDDVAAGAARVLVGFLKKLVVADNAVLLIELLEKHPSPSRGSVVLLIVLLSIRILFDFSGYSDIAIGLGRMVGLTLPENFRTPYAATDLADFWRRWHMSLSSWIRDYLYIPMGGGRVSPVRKGINHLVTMFLCGLWHGPAWHFGLWGVYHGLGLAVHDLWQRGRAAKNGDPSPWGRLGGLVLTNVFVGYGWLVFFYPLEKVMVYTKVLVLGG